MSIEHSNPLLDENSRIRSSNRTTNIDCGQIQMIDASATCRICFGDSSEGKLFSPCKCKGTMGYVHVECLQKWRIEKEKSPSYYRCDQCHYNYNLKRVDAAGFLKNPCVIEMISVTILLIICALASILSYTIVPHSIEIIHNSPKLNSLLMGLLIVGLISFFLSLLLPECQKSRHIVGGGGSCLNGGGGCLNSPGLNHCPGGIPFEAGASEFICVILLMALIYFAITGIIRAIVFTYDMIHMLAREGAELLETTVLDIAESPNTSHLIETV
mmetsp:Transcript_25378/g.30077  ORF Transcript_25378/g.30077 Transcript_25378/m.30077 type:complete len:271 (-) Transcript_25378:65-877(-)